jgi:hypothetical protein
LGKQNNSYHRIYHTEGKKGAQNNDDASGSCGGLYSDDAKEKMA